MSNKAYIIQQDICKPLLKHDYKKEYTRLAHYSTDIAIGF